MNSPIECNNSYTSEERSQRPQPWANKKEAFASSDKSIGILLNREGKDNVDNAGREDDQCPKTKSEWIHFRFASFP